MLRPAGLDRVEGLRQAEDAISTLVGRGDDLIRQGLAGLFGMFLGNLRRLLKQLGGRGVGVRGELADHHGAKAVAEQLAEAGHILLCARKDQPPRAGLPVEVLRQLGCVLQVLPGCFGFMALVALGGPATSPVHAHFLAEIPFYGFQISQVEEVEPGAHLIHVDHADLVVRVQKRRQLVYVRPMAHEHRVLHSHWQAFRPPEVLRSTTEHNDAAALPVVAHLHVVLDFAAVFWVSLLCLLEQAAQGEFVLFGGATVRIDVEVDAQDRMISAFELNCLPNS